MEDIRKAAGLPPSQRGGKEGIKPVILKGWAVMELDGKAFQVPDEVTRHRLSGQVFGHPKKRDGEEIVSSPVTQVKGRWSEVLLVTTESGTVYELQGPPSVDYKAWMTQQGFVPRVKS